MTSLTSTPAVSWRPQSFFSHAIASASQIDRLNAEGGIAVDFRPTRGAPPALVFEGGQSPSTSLWQTASRSGFLTIPKLDVDVVTIRFVIEGAMVRRDHGGEYIGRPGHAMMVMFEAMRNEEASSGFAAVSGTVTRKALVAAHLALDGGDSPAPLPRFLPVVDATGPALRTLLQTMERVFQQIKAGVQSADLVFPLLEEIMVYRLLTSWPRAFPDGLREIASTGQRPLKRAKDYIDGHLAEKLLLADVASAAGVGVRRLQLVFRTEMGKTPVQYILDRRLDRVRADLRTPSDQDTPIGTIAARWGFTHMGEFGRRYRARFGEQPSLTRRARPASPAIRPR